MHRRSLVAGVFSLVTLFVTLPAAAQTRTPPPAAGAPAAASATDRSITVTYKGKGTVDAAHDLIVFAFADPNVNASSRPIGTQYIQKNGGTATFSGLTDPVYFFVVYDHAGNYDGRSGPPAAGTPMAMYSAGPKKEPAAVKAGAKVKMTFDDSVVWK
jgi:hypothetical protein